MALHNNFSWNTVREFIDIDEHILYAESLIAKYKWSGNVRAGLMAQLDKIKSKQRDTALNLSVVGEFSTGKSSFINALLGEQLLVSSVIQGTTVVNTVIEYCDRPCICVMYRDGRYEVRDFSAIIALSKELSILTTDRKSARDIKIIRVGIPSQLLKSGIRIIDTPGTNSLESWHEDVTREALRDLSDLSIILTDATHPLPVTLTDFMMENLADIYTQCAFVATYYDMVPKRERADVLRYITRKLSTEFDIEEPVVLPYVAPAVIARNNGDTDYDNRDEFAELSDRSAETLFRYMAQKRQIAQIKKVLALTSEEFSLLDVSITQNKQDLERKLDLLYKSKRTDLSSFIGLQKTVAVNDYAMENRSIRMELIEKCEKRISKSKYNLKNLIRSKQSIEELKNFMQNEFAGKCEEEAKAVSRCVEDVFPDQMALFNVIIENFQEAFEKEFKKLGILKVNFNSKSTEVSVSDRGALTNLKDATAYVSKELSKENWAAAGTIAAAITGAAIGSAIPVVGTVIGGVIGFIAGSFMMPDDKKVINNLVQKVSPQLDAMFAKVESDVLAAFDANSDRVTEAIGREIDRYLAEYKSIVDRQLKEYLDRSARLQNEIRMVNYDLRIIENHKQQLLSASDKITQYIHGYGNK